MVGLSDIPFVGKAVDKISEAMVELGIRGLRYLLCYKSFVDDLKSEIKKVNDLEEDISSKAAAERADGKTIKHRVTEWQEQVQEIKIHADELSRQRPSNCFNIAILPNPLTRFRLGRKAAHEAQNVAKLTVSGKELLANEIAYHPADENIPMPDTTYRKFGSREEAYQKLWEVLEKEDGHPIIGIYGMPGVGKTRMMEQAWEDAKHKKVFDKVTRANVGNKKFDVQDLQNQLAGYLDCHLKPEDNLLRRTSQLENSFENAGKTLVILDDVWERIHLKKLAIPHDGDDISKGCKILLTSRKKDVCTANGCEDPVKIEALTDAEAWNMFKETVGTSTIDSLQGTTLAKKVCEKCAGLPLLIHVLGNALKLASEASWENALFHLENCQFNEIEGIDPEVYSCIQLSFNHLKKPEKTCLLLCSLFPEDSVIEIKMLADLATGSQLLSRGLKIRGLVDNLKSSSLLLEGEYAGTVKIHDVIRDVARYVAASEQEYAFLYIRGESDLPIEYRAQKLMQLVESHNFVRLAGMMCPALHTLWLECDNESEQLSNCFFKGFGNLKTLVVKGMHIFPEQTSVKTFDKLSMLVLDGCELNETWLRIVPENLQTLRISKCRLPCPLDLPKLKSLRKLEVLSEDVIDMVPNAISALSPTLAELHIPSGFKLFDAEGTSPVTISSELNKFTALTSLNIWLEETESCPSENILVKLREYVINVGYVYYKLRLFDSERLVFLGGRCIEGGVKVLVERAEEVYLWDVKGSRDGLSNREAAYSNLKKLNISYCLEMEHLAWIEQNEIQQIQPPTSFSKLTSLLITGCMGLKFVFSTSGGKCLLQLERLYIESCGKLEVVIRKESENDGDIIKFPKLKSIRLINASSLRRFYGGDENSRSTSTVDKHDAGSEYLFDRTVEFPALEYLEIRRFGKSEIWEKNDAKNINSFGRLKHLVILKNNHLEFAIPHNMLPLLQNLQVLEIRNCNGMRPEVERSNSNECPVPLVALHSIKFSWMPKLRQTGINSIGINLCPNLQTLRIEECDSLRNVLLPSIAKQLLHIKEIYVSNCSGMVEIIREGVEINDSEEAQLLTRQQLYPTLQVPIPKSVELESSDDATISLVKLESITLQGLGNLKSFSRSTRYTFNMPALKSVTLYKCGQMENFTCSEISMPLIPDFNTQFHQYLSSSDKEEIMIIQ